MSTETPAAEQWARIVPAEVDGDIMYAGGMICRRGRLLEEHTERVGHPVYEWWPIKDEDVSD